MRLLKFLLLILATGVVWLFPPLGIALAIGFALMVLWDDWKRDNPR